MPAPRPPYATDEPHTVYYDSNATNHRRIRQKPPPDPNDRTSAYNVYDDYLYDSNDNTRGVEPAPVPAPARPPQMHNVQRPGPVSVSSPRTVAQPSSPRTVAQPSSPRTVAQPSSPRAVAQPSSPMASPMSTTHPPSPMSAAHPPSPMSAVHPSSPISIAQPRPGYAAPIAALNLAQPVPPTPRGPPIPRYDPSPRNSPHPLQPPSSPIVPVFAAPKTSDSVRFARQSPVMRGQSEETLIPKHGNDFWRRFSMVVKEESAKPTEERESSWLRETQSGSSCLSRWVWCIGILILVLIGGAVALGWYFTHNNQQNQRPASLGGSQDESSTISSSSILSSVAPSSSSGTSKHVSPTNTVARRAPIPTAFVGHDHVIRMPH